MDVGTRGSPLSRSEGGAHGAKRNARGMPAEAETPNNHQLNPQTTTSISSHPDENTPSAETNTPLSRSAGEGQGEGDRGGQEGGAPQTTNTQTLAIQLNQPIREFHPMRQLTVTEAKANFSQLLDAVEQGETVVITRHGKKIAHIVPAADQERADRLEAMERLKKTRSELGGIKMSINEILEARHAGLT